MYDKIQKMCRLKTARVKHQLHLIDNVLSQQQLVWLLNFREKGYLC